jgi:3-deoxy-D-manno-octulosonic-acid transferase
MTPEVLHTYTSPSVARWPGLLPAVRSDYLPLDRPADVARVLDALAPALLVVGRGDLWPELLWQAARRYIPVAVVGATMRRGSFRYAAPARSLYAKILSSVSWVGAVTAEDAERWRRAGAPVQALEVSGDPRHDEVLERLTDLHAIAPLEPWAAEALVLVAGSVEQADEAPLFRAAATVLGAVPEARLLVVPHDADDAATHRLHARAEQAGLESGVWAGTEEPPRVRCLIAPVTGVLYHLYALGAIAYVGGGFTPGKLHSVIEPAAYALPILTGPHLAGAADAESLAAAGALVPAHGRDAAESIAAAWHEMLRDGGERRTGAGLAARRALGEGAAAHSAAKVGELLAART